MGADVVSTTTHLGVGDSGVRHSRLTVVVPTPTLGVVVVSTNRAGVVPTTTHLTVGDIGVRHSRLTVVICTPTLDIVVVSTYGTGVEVTRFRVPQCWSVSY